MSDLINREDAIELIIKWFAAIELNPDILIDSIISCPSADKPQEWIPCSERLPSKGVAVLVNGIMYDAPPITISADAPYYYEQGWINAWMPLPKPWKGADDELWASALAGDYESKVTERLTAEVRKSILNKDTYGYRDNDKNFERGLENWVSYKIDNILKAHKDEIIDAAAEKLAERLARTKKAKEILKEE